LTLGVVNALAGQDTAIPSVPHVREGDRLYAHFGPRSTILGGSSYVGGFGRLTTRMSLWFRDGQFLFTYSSFTKE